MNENHTRESWFVKSKLTDEESHDLQNRLDIVIDKIADKNANMVLVMAELIKIRDDIPCSCGEENQ